MIVEREWLTVFPPTRCGTAFPAVCALSSPMCRWCHLPPSAYLTHHDVQPIPVQKFSEHHPDEPKSVTVVLALYHPALGAAIGIGVVVVTLLNELMGR
ncbi:hypothetical protein ACIHEJ_34900 [Streptomyces sp. NPDC052301]|uniref:hypothetical protein n=1 Tax=Streptomyces sp. NPDC052301 TaxID=3365687 RepID=UPI0037D80095